MRELIRRTFALNNFESLTIEADAEDPNPIRARLLAAHSLLSKAEREMIRIFNVRKQHQTSSEYDGVVYNQVLTELQWITAELENLPNLPNLQTVSPQT